MTSWLRPVYSRSRDGHATEILRAILRLRPKNVSFYDRVHRFPDARPTITRPLGGQLIWTCFELRLQQNLHESTISQQRTSRNNSINFASQRPLLAKVVHVIGNPPRLYIVHSLHALCTMCGNYLLRSRTCTALKSSQEHHEYGIINSHQRPITACRVLVRMDFGRLCVCCVCAVHTAWTWTGSGRPWTCTCTVRILVTMWFVHRVFNWLYVFSETTDSNSGPDHGKIKSSKYLELSNLLV